MKEKKARQKLWKIKDDTYKQEYIYFTLAIIEITIEIAFLRENLKFTLLYAKLLN